MMPPNVVTKRRPVYDYFCNICQSFLLGNGSVMMPYHCECGTYESDYSAMKYKIVKVKESTK